jgi:hypothetical protein
MPENKAERWRMRRAPVRRRPSSSAEATLPIGRHADISATSSQVMHKPLIQVIFLA